MWGTIVKASSLVCILVLLQTVSVVDTAFGAYQDPQDRVYAGRDANNDIVYRPYLADIREFDAGIVEVNNHRYLSVFVGMANWGYEAQPRLSIFIDADADPTTGCILPGWPRGAEYRIDAEVQMKSMFDYYKKVSAKLWQLPKNLAESGAFAQENLNAGRGRYPARRLVSTEFSAPTEYGLDKVAIAFPVELLGDTANANVWVSAYLPVLTSVNPFSRSDLPNMQGDRAPDFGEYNTTLRDVVNVGPISEVVTLDDPPGDNLIPGSATQAGPDLRRIQFLTVGSQFCMVLVFQDDVMQSLWDPNVGFAIRFDADRLLETGQIVMGDKVPTWGGDVSLNWLAPPLAAHSFYITNGWNMTDEIVDVGGPAGTGHFAVNDGQWRVEGNQIYIQFDNSLLDVFKTTDLAPGLPLGPAVFERFPPAEGVRLSAEMLVQNVPQFNEYTDWAPTRHWAFDTATREAIPPLAFDVAETHLLTDQDPLLKPELDITGIIYQVDPDFLVARAGIESWIPGEKQLVFEMHLDVDSNTSTGVKISNGGVAVMGAEYTVQVTAFDDYGRVGYNLYLASAVSGAGGVVPKASRHDAWLKVVPPSEYVGGTPGTITITIPRAEIPLAKDRVGVLFDTAKTIRYANNPPFTTYHDYLPNFLPVTLDLSSDGSPLNGRCGSANGASFPSKPVVDLCAAGTASTVVGAGSWLWSCNGSNGGTTAYCSAHLSDTVRPTVSAFAMPAVATSLTVAITAYTAADNVGVTGYLVTETATAPAADAPQWNLTPPASFTFSGYGRKTAYGWAKDAAGNVSNAAVAAVTVTAVPGDCDNSGSVTIAELQAAFEMFLSLKPVLGCVDLDVDGSVRIVEVQRAINAFLGL